MEVVPRGGRAPCASSTAAAAPSAAAAGRRYEAILAQPPGSVQGELRLTEQGEVIASKYANREIGRRNLEALVAGHGARDDRRGPARGARDLPRGDGGDLRRRPSRPTAASSTRRRASSSISAGPRPLREIAELNIGSRPASRKPSTRIEDLRAIPWVFSWAQCRVMLPGWYGLGSAVEAFLAKHDEPGYALLAEMWQEWPFFRAMLSNLEMLLAKADLAVAARYKELVPDPKLADEIFGRIRRELDLTVKAYFGITKARGFLETNPTLARSIRNRFPYLDPLNHVQVELLKRYRAGDAEERVSRGIHLTINGLAAGLRNSG